MQVRDEMRQWLDRIKLQCTDAELDELMEVMNSSSDDRGVCFEDLLQFYQAQRRR
jgi:Ca2+-binding EF-hand superfamily protein